MSLSSIKDLQEMLMR